MAWVLIVDDDSAIRQMLEFALHDAGYAIVAVGNGKDALDVLRVTPHHAVVLLDILMPGMNGRRVLDTLEDDHALAQRHAWIVMSADNEELQRITPKRCADLSLTLIEKPFDINELLKLVDEQARHLPPDGRLMSAF